MHTRPFLKPDPKVAALRPLIPPGSNLKVTATRLPRLDVNGNSRYQVVVTIDSGKDISFLVARLFRYRTAKSGGFYMTDDYGAIHLALSQRLYGDQKSLTSWVVKR